MGDLNPYAINAIITMMVHVLLNATSATELAIWPMTGHFKRECPKLKNNNNRGNQVRGGNVPAKVYAVGHARTNPDSNVMTGTFLLNNHYASILFDTGADRSFVSTAFSSQIDITPTTLDHYYDVELADRRIIRLNTILRGCTLNILNHPFNIDLMPVELGSFDAIIGMDWLVKYQAIIVCAEKIVRIPWGNETLIVHGDGSNRGNEAHLHIISYTKTQEYMLKGCPVFLADGPVFFRKTLNKYGERKTSTEDRSRHEDSVEIGFATSNSSPQIHVIDSLAVIRLVYAGYYQRFHEGFFEDLRNQYQASLPKKVKFERGGQTRNSVATVEAKVV
ncbi:putative reverse transcriptase domain-containing protein [Tanacetum coccineum]